MTRRGVVVARLALTLGAVYGCGGRSRYDAGPADTEPAELIPALCRATQGSDCSPMKSLEGCIQVFEGEHEVAIASGCEAESTALIVCFAARGFHCAHGNLIWSDGCELENAELSECLGRAP